MILTVALIVLCVVLVARLVIVQAQRDEARAEAFLRANRIGRLTHANAELQRKLDAALWSRDQTALDNAALRGEYVGVNAVDAIEGWLS